VDDVDQQILTLLGRDARRTYDDIGQRIGLSAPAVKRRIDNLRSTGALIGFTTVVDHEAQGYLIEAFVHLYYVPGAKRADTVAVLQERSEIVEAWMVTGDADAIAHVRVRDAGELEDLLFDLKQERVVERTKSEVVLSRMVMRGGPQ
jgi:Lrp/AsnC family transcriptional regulator, leucine-responsive regulatory protein